MEELELLDGAGTAMDLSLIQTGELTSLAMNRAFETLKRFQDLAQSYKVDNLSIAATSAVREAPNGRSFLVEIKEKR